MCKIKWTNKEKTQLTWYLSRWVALESMTLGFSYEIWATCSCFALPTYTPSSKCTLSSYQFLSETNPSKRTWPISQVLDFRAWWGPKLLLSYSLFLILADSFSYHQIYSHVCVVQCFVFGSSCSHLWLPSGWAGKIST